MWGFNSLKDLLDVLILPLFLFGLGVWLPRQFERQKRNAFINLIRRELSEMEPDPKLPQPNGRWHQHLKKRFIHEAIIGKASENRDFILSLPPDLAYNLAQMWIHFDKATAATGPSDLAEHGARWCDYLRGVCAFFDGRKGGQLYRQVCAP